MTNSDTIAVKDVTMNPEIADAGYQVWTTNQPGLWMVRNLNLGEDVFVTALAFQQFVFKILQLSANKTQSY